MFLSEVKKEDEEGEDSDASETQEAPAKAVKAPKSSVSILHNLFFHYSKPFSEKSTDSTLICIKWLKFNYFTVNKILDNVCKENREKVLPYITYY